MEPGENQCFGELETIKNTLKGFGRIIQYYNHSGDKNNFGDPQFNIFDGLYEGQILITGTNVFARWIDCENKGYIGHYSQGKHSHIGANFDE